MALYSAITLKTEPGGRRFRSTNQARISSVGAPSSLPHLQGSKLRNTGAKPAGEAPAHPKSGARSYRHTAHLLMFRQTRFWFCADARVGRERSQSDQEPVEILESAFGKVEQHRWKKLKAEQHSLKLNAGNTAWKSWNLNNTGRQSWIDSSRSFPRTST